MIDESNPSCSICASVSVAADLKAVPKLLPCLEPKVGCATTPKTRHIFSVNTAQRKLPQNFAAIDFAVQLCMHTAHTYTHCTCRLCLHLFKKRTDSFPECHGKYHYVRVPINLLAAVEVHVDQQQQF